MPCGQPTSVGDTMVHNLRVETSKKDVRDIQYVPHIHHDSEMA